MNESKLDSNSAKKRGNLRNFDLSVEEIMIIKAIKKMTLSLEGIELTDTQPERLNFFRNEIKKLEYELEEVRENTLIR